MRPVLLLFLLALLAACAPPASPAPPLLPPAEASSVAVAPTSEAVPALGTDGSVTITFAVNDNAWATYEPLAERFMAEHPDIVVQIVAQPEPQRGPTGTFQLSEFQRQLAEAADSFTVWAGSAEATRLGLFLDLTPLLDADPSFDRADFLPGALARSMA